MGTMFNIAAPFAIATDGSTDIDESNSGGAVGQCTVDTFQVSGSGGASPVICGNNDGQHMIVDTDGAACVTAVFSFGSDTTTRNYRIHAIQYDRLNEMGGPAGCLQFFTGAMGTVNTFNWATATTSTHLANQDYDVCVRRLTDRCSICWSPITTGTNPAAAAGAVAAIAAARGSFGLNNGASATIAPAAGTGANCFADAADSNDYIIIPNGLVGATAAAVAAAAAVTQGVDKYCGRYLNAQAETADLTVCTQVTPFRLSVFTDNIEVVAAVAANAVVGKSGVNEAAAGAADLPTGTMGFSLGFNQIAC